MSGLHALAGLRHPPPQALKIKSDDEKSKKRVRQKKAQAGRLIARSPSSHRTIAKGLSPLWGRAFSMLGRYHHPLWLQFSAACHSEWCYFAGKGHTGAEPDGVSRNRDPTHAQHAGRRAEDARNRF